MASSDTFSWYWMGGMPLFLVLVCYGYNVAYRVSVWEFFWVCPVTAFFIGLAIFAQSRFFMSAAVPWAVAGPFMVVVLQTDFAFRIWHLHHVASVVAWAFILLHWRRIWHRQGFLFGVCFLYAYGALTAYFSGGLINLLIDWWPPNALMLGLGVIFAGLSGVLFFQYFTEKTVVRRIH